MPRLFKRALCWILAVALEALVGIACLYHRLSQLVDLLRRGCFCKPGLVAGCTCVSDEYGKSLALTGASMLVSQNCSVLRLGKKEFKNNEL